MAAIISDSDNDSRVGPMLPIAPRQRVSQKGHGKFKSRAATPQDIEDALNDSGEERRDDDSQQDDDGEEPEPRGGCDDLESEVCTMTLPLYSCSGLRSCLVH